jgi:hypothetical protein
MSFGRILLAGLVALAPIAPAALAQAPQDGKITGTVVINFKSRVHQDNGDMTDTYATDLSFTQGSATFNWNGAIDRVYSGIAPIGLRYNNLAITGGKLKDGKLDGKMIDVGKLNGVINLDTNGVYSFPGGEDGLYFERLSGMKSLGKASYTGRIAGKKPATKAWWEKLTGTAKCSVRKVAPASVTTLLAGRAVKVMLTKPDPFRFNDVSIGAGPLSTPGANVSGSMIYGYTRPDSEDGTWALNGMTIGDDHVSGFISFVSLPEGNAKEMKVAGINGQTAAPTAVAITPTGYYEFSVRYNEKSSADASADLSSETSSSPAAAGDELDAVLADDKVPTGITGRVWYVDSDQQSIEVTDESCNKKTTTIPAASHIYYDLTTHGLDYRQAQNFLKVWLLAVAPVNDP